MNGEFLKRTKMKKCNATVFLKWGFFFCSLEEMVGKEGKGPSMNGPKGYQVRNGCKMQEALSLKMKIYCHPWVYEHLSNTRYYKDLKYSGEIELSCS